MVVGFLVLNMVVGIVVSNYQLCQEKQENADRKLKSPKAKIPLTIVDKTRYGKNKTCLHWTTVNSSHCTTKNTICNRLVINKLISRCVLIFDSLLTTILLQVVYRFIAS